MHVCSRIKMTHALPSMNDLMLCLNELRLPAGMGVLHLLSSLVLKSSCKGHQTRGLSDSQKAAGLLRMIDPRQSLPRRTSAT